MKLQENIDRTKELMNIVNFSDLTNSGHWDSKYHARPEKGLGMYKMDGGLLKKSTSTQT